MTLTELLANEELRRHEFPVARDKIFLAHAGVCPLPRRVAQAISDCAQCGTTNDQETLVFPRRLNEGRKLAAQLAPLPAGRNRVRRADVAGPEFRGRRAEFSPGRQHSDLPRRLSVERLSVDGACRPRRRSPPAQHAWPRGHPSAGTWWGRWTKTRGSSRSLPVILSAVSALNLKPSENSCASAGFFFASTPFKRSVRFRPGWNTWIFWPPTRISGCSARVAPACFMFDGSSGPAERRRFTAGTTSTTRILLRRKRSFSARRDEVRSRHTQSGGAGRLDCRDGTGFGNRRGKYRRRVVAQTHLARARLAIPAVLRF